MLYWELPQLEPLALALSEKHGGAAARQLKLGAGDDTAAVIEGRIASLKDHTVNARGNSISRYFTRRSKPNGYLRA